MEFIAIKQGQSVEGAEIKAFRTEKKANQYIYLMAGTHGDEVEGVYVLEKLFDWLKKQDDIDLPLVVIPILNVDGFRVGTRVNAHGVDLNRNYASRSWSPIAREAKYNPGTKALSEPENIFLDKLFAKYHPKLIISFHSWKPMINYNGACKDIAEFLESYNGYVTCDDIAGHPTPGSLGEYAPEKYQSPVLTFECPVLSADKNLKEIWEENEEAFKQLMRSPLLSSR